MTARVLAQPRIVISCAFGPSGFFYTQCMIGAKLLTGFAVAFLLVGASARAATVISVMNSDQDELGAGFVGSAIAESWTLSQQYENVTILASLGFGPREDTAYLTTSLGPGTTPADEVAETVFDFPAGSTPTWTTLFSGLSLSPGTYYLTLNENDFGAPGGAWFGNPTGIATVTLGEGVSEGTSYVLFPRVVDGPAIYPPSTQYVDAYPDDEFGYQVLSESQAIPEPDVTWTMTLGLAAIFICSRSRSCK